MSLKEAFTCRIYLSNISRDIVGKIVNRIASKYNVNVKVKESINVSDFYLVEFILNKPVNQNDVRRILVDEGIKDLNFKVDILKVKVPQ